VRTYRAVFRLGSPSLTPWQADTLFGHLCWALVRREGEQALGGFLDLYRAGHPPLILSDGMPGDLLPRPLFPDRLVTDGTVAQRTELLRRGKRAKSSPWLSREAFAHALAGNTNQEGVGTDASVFYTLHNQINRATGTTTGPDDDEGGRLYHLSGDWCVARTVYLRVDPDAAIPWRELLGDVARDGFGKRKSVGYGHVTGLQIQDFGGFGEPSDADGFVTLSSFVPAPDDPTDGYWSVSVKYGKLGEERASGTGPFKRPLVRLGVGSAFRCGARPRLSYGRLVENIAPAHPDVVQYGLAFAVGLRWPS